MSDDGDDGAPTKLLKDGRIDRRGKSPGSRANQFSAGDGRRRPGRGKGATGMKSDLRMIMNMTVVATVGGKERKLSTRQALLMKQRAKAMAGDQRATEYLLNRFAEYEPEQARQDVTGALLEEDLEILKSASARGLIVDPLVDDENEG